MKTKNRFHQREKNKVKPLHKFLFLKHLDRTSEFKHDDIYIANLLIEFYYIYNIIYYERIYYQRIYKLNS